MKYYVYSIYYGRYGERSISKKATEAPSPVYALYTIDDDWMHDMLTDVVDGVPEDPRVLRQLFFDTYTAEELTKREKDSYGAGAVVVDERDPNKVGFWREETVYGVAPTKEGAYEMFQRADVGDDSGAGEDWEGESMTTDDKKKNWSPERREIERLVDEKVKKEDALEQEDEDKEDREPVDDEQRSS